LESENVLIAQFTCAVAIATMIAAKMSLRRYTPGPNLLEELYAQYKIFT